MIVSWERQKCRKRGFKWCVFKTSSKFRYHTCLALTFPAKNDRNLKVIIKMAAIVSSHPSFFSRGFFRRDHVFEFWRQIRGRLLFSLERSSLKDFEVKLARFWIIKDFTILDAKFRFVKPFLPRCHLILLL